MPAPSSKKGADAEPHNFRSIFIVPSLWMHQDATWYGGRPQPRRLCVKWGPSPSQKGAEPPIFGLRLLWPNGCIDQVDQDATWYGVRWEPSSPPPKGTAPQFLVNVRCGQTAGWTKICHLVWRYRPIYVRSTSMWPNIYTFSGHMINPSTKFEAPTTFCSSVMSSDTSIH